MGVRYACRWCGYVSPLNRPLPRCPICGSPLEIETGEQTFTALSGSGIWRYARYLPPLKNKVSRGEGSTPLLRASRLGEAWGLSKLYIKDETRNPTGSFIDRGVALVVSAALDYGYRSIFCWGEGDLGASVAAYAAVAGLSCLYEPRGPLDSLKLLQIAVYGAQIGAKRRGDEYYLWPGDPFLVEGYKTLALEVVEELKRSPSAVVVQVGHGSLAYGLWKGFELAMQLGMAGEVPRFYAAQENVCAPVVRALRGEAAEVTPAQALSGLSADLLVTSPARLREVVAIVRKSGGGGVSVSAKEILFALRELACKEGILVAPSAAVGLAALRKLRESGEIDKDEDVLIIATGSGVRSPRALVKALGRGGVFKSRTKLAIMRFLEDEVQHPYGLWRRLLARGFSLTKQAVYKHLRELERDGYVVSWSEGRKKVYSLTEKGRQLLESFGPGSAGSDLL